MVRKRGGGAPVRNQNIFFLQKRETYTKCAETEDVYFGEKFVKYIHLGLLYVLDYSWYFFMHIEKWKSGKKAFPYRILWTGPHLIVC